MDREGVPIGIKSFPGNTADKATMIKSTSEIIGPMGISRYIYCADRGLCTMGNLAFLVNDGQGYLLSKSIKKSKKEDRDWVVDPSDYIEEKDENGTVTFKHKSRVVNRSYTDEKGNTTTFQEKVVSFWSLNYYKRELHQMKSFADFLKKLETDTKGFTLNSSQVKQVYRFLKDDIRESLDPKNDVTPEEETPESTPVKPEADSEKPKTVAKSKRQKLTPEEKAQREEERKKAKIQREADKKAENARNKHIKEARKKELNEQLKNSEAARKMIDWDKVNQWRDFAGYYQIVTSEIKMSDKEVITTYRGLTQIEDRFRTMKGPLKTRPIYLRNPDHIDGHLVLCEIALTIDSLIQGKTRRYLGLIEDEEKKWYMGQSPDRVQDALNAFQVETLPRNYLRFRSMSNDQSGKDLHAILKAHGIDFEARLYTPGELHRQRGSITVL